MRANLADGAFKQRLAVGTQADLMRDIVGQSLVGRTVHHLQRRTDATFAEYIQEGRLFQLDGKGLLQCAVEHRVSGCVYEVSDNYGVFLRELGGLVCPLVEPSSDGSCHEQYRRTNSGEKLPVPARPRLFVFDWRRIDGDWSRPLKRFSTSSRALAAW